MSYTIPRQRFEELTDEAVRLLPPDFRALLRNIVVLVEDLPSREDAEAVDVPRDELLGLFRGVSREEENGFFEVPSPFPNEVILYQRNLEAFCDSEEELIEEIRETIAHEVGHYFGLSDEGMEDLE